MSVPPVAPPSGVGWLSRFKLESSGSVTTIPAPGCSFVLFCFSAFHLAFISLPSFRIASASSFIDAAASRCSCLGGAIPRSRYFSLGTETEQLNNSWHGACALSHQYYRSSVRGSCWSLCSNACGSGFPIRHQFRFLSEPIQRPLRDECFGGCHPSNVKSSFQRIATTSSRER
jgi:hypothetical protein